MLMYVLVGTNMLGVGACGPMSAKWSKKAKAAYYADVLELEEFKAEQEAIRQGVAAAEAIIAKWSVELDGITHSLDEALQLLTNPQVLYDALPEGLKALLVQAVFEKVWLLDTAVVGSALTPPIADLLTWEARLAVERQSRMDAATSSVTLDDDGPTYHRDRSPDSWTSRATASLRDFVRVERPHGLLAADRKNLHPQGGRGSKIAHLVGVTGFKLNRELATFIREHPQYSEQQSRDNTNRVRNWRIRQRLSADDITELVTAFNSGTPKWRLAERYMINIKSVKKLLREEGMKRRLRQEQSP
jgi:hypothetical protein